MMGGVAIYIALLSDMQARGDAVGAIVILG